MLNGKALKGAVLDSQFEKKYYMTPAGMAFARFTVQGSRFIGTISPVSTEAAVADVLDQIREKYPGATHHAYAFRIGIESLLIERSSDDGEPANSAGAPMLQVLQGHNLADTLVIGTRYFGGTRLGIGGLTRAYRDCARLSLKEARLQKKEPAKIFNFKLEYEYLGPFTRLIESLEGKIMAVDYKESVTLKVKIPVRLKAQLIAGFESICRGQGSWHHL